jgi:hypothetical protein
MYKEWTILKKFVPLLSYVDSKMGVYVQIPTMGGVLNSLLGHLPAEQQLKVQDIIFWYLDVLAECLGQTCV